MTVLILIAVIGTVLVNGSPQYYQGPPGANTKPWGSPMTGYQGPASQYTRPWGSMSQSQPMMQMRSFPGEVSEAKYGSAQLPSSSNVQILPGYAPLQDSQSLPQVQSAALPTTYQSGYQKVYNNPQQQPGWMRSYSPLPGTGNCFNSCKNRCGTGSYNSGSYNPGSYNSGSYNPGSYNSGSYNPGSFNSGSYNAGSYNSGSYNPGSYNSGSYNTYSGCKPTCTSRCNIRPSCPSMNKGNWMYSSNTLYCGNRQPQMPIWLTQQQSQGQGFNPGYSTLPASVNYPTYPKTQSAGCNMQSGCSDPMPGSYNPQIQGPGYSTLPGKIEWASDESDDDTGSGDAVAGVGE